MLNIVKKVKFDFLCWKIMSLTDQNCVDWRWALSFAQHTPVSAAFENHTTLCVAAWLVSYIKTHSIIPVSNIFNVEYWLLVSCL